jgi:hypothetical protein
MVLTPLVDIQVHGRPLSTRAHRAPQSAEVVCWSWKHCWLFLASSRFFFLSLGLPDIPWDVFTGVKGSSLPNMSTGYRKSVLTVAVPKQSTRLSRSRRWDPQIFHIDLLPSSFNKRCDPANTEWPHSGGTWTYGGFSHWQSSLWPPMPL